MDDSRAKALQTVPGSLPNKRDVSSFQRALVDRLTPSAAIEVVSRLIGLFPNGGKDAGDDYIGGLAQILANYPRSVAARAADPINGVARDTDFLPTPAVLIAWCERQTAPLHEDWIAAKRISETVIEPEPEPKATEAIVSAARAWLKREDPKAQKLTGKSVDVELVKDEAKRESNREALERRKAETVAEYERAGLQPLSIGKIPISIELARIMGVEPSTRRRDEDAA
jgi:hypothetical protein